MSRISLNLRLAAILNAVERVGPLAARVYRLPPALRLRYDSWRAHCDEAIAAIEREHGPGAAYAMLADGEAVTPDPPRDVVRALGLSNAPHLPDTMSTSELADRWSQMVAR